MCFFYQNAEINLKINAEKCYNFPPLLLINSIFFCLLNTFYVSWTLWDETLPFFCPLVAQLEKETYDFASLGTHESATNRAKQQRCLLSVGKTPTILSCFSSREICLQQTTPSPKRRATANYQSWREAEGETRFPQCVSFYLQLYWSEHIDLIRVFSVRRMRSPTYVVWL